MGQNLTTTKAKLVGPLAGLAIGLSSLTFMAGPASATSCPTYGPNPCTTPVSSYTGSSHGSTPAASSSSSLAFTGTDVALTATAGAGAVAAGGMIVLATRRRRTIS